MFSDQAVLLCVAGAVVGFAGLASAALAIPLWVGLSLICAGIIFGYELRRVLAG